MAEECSSNTCFDLYIAEQYYLTTEQVIERLDREDPNRRSDAYRFATPEIAKEAPKLKDEEICSRFRFFTALAEKLHDEKILSQIASEHPKKSKGGYNLAKIQRIACAPIVTRQCKILQLFAKASEEHTITIEADFRRFSPEEMAYIKNDLLTRHADLFFES